jgi:TRAP-type C4-dicarboxylate transport system permease large subunit
MVICPTIKTIILTDAGRALERDFNGIVPFFCAHLCRLSIVVAFPSVALWLPKLVYGPF